MNLLIISASSLIAKENIQSEKYTNIFTLSSKAFNLHEMVKS